MARVYNRDTMGRFAPGGGSKRSGGKLGGKGSKRGKMLTIGVPIMFRGFSKAQMRKMFPKGRK